MKRILTGILLLLSALAAGAQSTQIIASHIAYFGSGTNTVTGSFCVSPTDQNAIPITITTPAGQQLAPITPLCFPIVNGVLDASAVVPDVSQTQPLNACLNTTIYNNLHIPIQNYGCLQPQGATWSFDAFVPGSTGSIPQLVLPQFQVNGVTNPAQGTVNFVGSGVTYGAGGHVVINGSGTASGSKTMYPALCQGSGAPSWCSGSTPDAYIRAACAALPTNGGRVDLVGLTGNLTATTRGCSTASRQVEIIQDFASLLTVTETDGDITFPLDASSSFIGPGVGQCLPSQGIHLSSSANIAAIVGPAHTDGTEESITVKGLCLNGAAGATVSQGLMYAKNIFVNTTFEGNNVAICNNACLKINNGSDMRVFNNEFNVGDGLSSGFTGQALILQGSGGGAGCNLTSIFVEDNLAAHSLGGSPEISITGDGAGAEVCNISLKNNAIERNPTGTGSTIGISISDCWGCTVDGVLASGNPTGATDLIKIAQTASGRTTDVKISQINHVFGTYTNTLNDTIKPRTLTSSAVPYLTDYVVSPGYLGFLLSDNNFSDLASASTARTNLGLGTAATAVAPATSSATSHQWVNSFTASTGAFTQSAIGAADTAGGGYSAAAGSVNVLTATLAPVPSALVTGMEINILPNLANTTTTPTLNVNGLGAKSITKNGTAALAAGDLTTTAIANLLYDGTRFQLLDPQTSGTVVAASVNAQVGTTYTVVAADSTKLDTFTNASAVAVTLPVASTSGFGSGNIFHFKNEGVGVVTITPTTSTIDGIAVLVLPPLAGVEVWSDGTNYHTASQYPVAGSAIPTCAVGSGAGTSATCTITAGSTNGSGQILIHSGSASTANNASVAAITLANGGFKALKFCVLGPADYNSGTIGVNMNAATTAAVLALYAGPNAMSISQNYTFNWICP